MKLQDVCISCGEMMKEIKNCSVKCFSCGYEEGACS